MLLDHRAMNSTQLSARLLESRTGRKAGEQLGHPMYTSGHHCCREMMRAGDDVSDNFSFGKGEPC